MKIRLTAVLTALLIGPCWADIVHLKDGRKIEGKVTDLGDRIKVERKIGSILLNKDDVLRIEAKEFAEAPVVAPPPPPPSAAPAKLPASSPSPLAAARPRPPVRLIGSHASLDGNFVVYLPANWVKAANWSALQGPVQGARIEYLLSESTEGIAELAESTKKAHLKGSPAGAACVGTEYFQLAGRPAVQLEFDVTFELRTTRTLIQVAKNEKTVVTFTFADHAKAFDAQWHETNRIMRSLRFFNRKGDLSAVQKQLFVDAWERGQAALKGGQGDPAVRAFRECTEIVPDLAPVQAGLVRGHLLQKEYRSAVVAAQLGLRIEPDHVVLNWLLAYSYVLWGKQDDAAQALKKTMAADPENDEAFFYAGLLFADKGKWVEAKDAWLKGTVSNPDSGRLHYALGVAYEKLGKRTEAADSYQRCIAVDPGVAEARERLSSLKK